MRRQESPAPHGLSASQKRVHTRLPSSQSPVVHASFDAHGSPSSASAGAHTLTVGLTASQPKPVGHSASAVHATVHQRSAPRTAQVPGATQCSSV